MSPAGPPSEDGVPPGEERIAKLRQELLRLFGEKKADELLRLSHEAGLRRIGVNASIAVFDAQAALPYLSRLWDEGVAAIAWSELVKADDYLTQQSARHRLILRVLRHYLEQEEYSAVLTSYELVAVLRDPLARVSKRSVVISGLYRRIDRFRYGRPIYNQVSSGRLDHRIYPAMRSLEASIATAGRVEGAEKERVKQVFYDAIQPNPAELWVNASDDPAMVFDTIRTRLLGLGGTHPLPVLDVYAVGSAAAVASAAIRDFMESYPEFVGERQPEGDVAGYVRLRRG